MNFQRAVVIAVMTDIMVTSTGVAANMVAVALGGILWFFAGDPLPKAIDEGLEAFASKHRRGGR
jgi:hypothetical protein